MPETSMEKLCICQVLCIETCSSETPKTKRTAFLLILTAHRYIDLCFTNGGVGLVTWSIFGSHMNWGLGSLQRSTASPKHAAKILLHMAKESKGRLFAVKATCPKQCQKTNWSGPQSLFVNADMWMIQCWTIERFCTNVVVLVSIGFGKVCAREQVKLSLLISSLCRVDHAAVHHQTFSWGSFAGMACRLSTRAYGIIREGLPRIYVWAYVWISGAQSKKLLFREKENNGKWEKFLTRRNTDGVCSKVVMGQHHLILGSTVPFMSVSWEQLINNVKLD